MYKYLLIGFSVFLSFYSFGQNEPKIKNDSTKVRNGIWFVPSLTKQINGIAIGPIGSDNICNLDGFQVSNGLNLQIIGSGLFLPLNTKRLGFRSYYQNNKNNDSLKQVIDIHLISAQKYKVKHNGLVISTFGTITTHVNGISISALASTHSKMNGISFNPAWNLITILNGIAIGTFNSSLKVNGLQVGLFNNTVYLKGFQIGFWNKNKQRSLPLINWGF